MIPREVVESPQFMEYAAAYREQFSLFDQVLDAIIWLLARDPETGTQIEAWGPEYWLIKTQAKGRTPAFRVLYTFHETQVQLLTIARIEADEF